MFFRPPISFLGHTSLRSGGEAHSLSLCEFRRRRNTYIARNLFLAIPARMIQADSIAEKEKIFERVLRPFWHGIALGDQNGRNLGAPRWRGENERKYFFFRGDWESERMNIFRRQNGVSKQYTKSEVKIKPRGIMTAKF